MGRAALSRDAAFATYAEAPRFIESGFAPVPIEFGRPAPVGPWPMYRYQDHHAVQYANYGVGIICAQPPATSWGILSLEQVSKTWCAAVEIESHDRALARDIDALVVKRLRWREGTPSAKSPVRVSTTGHGTLRLFGLAPGAPVFDTLFTASYYLPADKFRSINFRPHRVRILCRGQAIVASGLDSKRVPYEWKGGDPMTTTRDELPIMTGQDAVDLMREVTALLQTRGSKWV